MLPSQNMLLAGQVFSALKDRLVGLPPDVDDLVSDRWAGLPIEYFIKTSSRARNLDFNHTFSQSRNNSGLTHAQVLALEYPILALMLTMPTGPTSLAFCRPNNRNGTTR